jgi:enoyl-CoA hydratase
VPAGTSREAAEALAAELARFPQVTLRADRRSAYEQDGLSVTDAMENELAVGRASLDQALRGAARFADGAGRGGSFSDL